MEKLITVKLVDLEKLAGIVSAFDCKNISTETRLAMVESMHAQIEKMAGEHAHLIYQAEYVN